MSEALVIINRISPFYNFSVANLAAGRGAPMAEIIDGEFRVGNYKSRT